MWRRRLFVCVRFVLHHTHTLRWKREITIRCRTAHHPSAATKKDSQGDGHRKKKKQKGEKQHKLAEPLSLSSAIVFQSYWLQCFHRQHCLPYIKLSHTSLLFCLSHFVVVVSLFFLFLFLIFFGRSHQLTNRPPLID